MASKRRKRSEPTHRDTLDYAAAARFLGVPKNTLYSYVHRGQVPHVRLGARLVRFERAALEEWWERRRREARPPRGGGGRRS